MFICNECGNVFEKVEILEERHPYGMGHVTEDLYVCPCCKDTNISRGVECSHCGELISELDARLDDGLQPLCDTCYEELYE